jgi:hypothetical protein
MDSKYYRSNWLRFKGQSGAEVEIFEKAPLPRYRLRWQASKKHVLKLGFINGAKRSISFRKRA